MLFRRTANPRLEQAPEIYRRESINLRDELLTALYQFVLAKFGYSRSFEITKNKN